MSTTPQQDQKIYAVCVLALGELDNNGKHKVVGVARRNNPNSFGLIGGKVDEADSSPVDAAIRECKEETGLILKNPIEVYRRCYDKGIVITYMGDVEGEISTQPNEPECKWCTLDELLAGRFGEYNKELFQKLGLTS